MNQETILDKTYETIKTYLENNLNDHNPVVQFKEPHELSKLINFKVNEQGVSEFEFLDMINQYLDYSVRTGNKQFLNQLYSGLTFRHLLVMCSPLWPIPPCTPMRLPRLPP